MCQAISVPFYHRGEVCTAFAHDVMKPPDTGRNKDIPDRFITPGASKHVIFDACIIRSMIQQ